MHKRIQWGVATLLALVSPALYALGLGSASVDSYLDQPLDVRVELISRTEGELESITVGLASADDFELLGLSLSAIMVPLEFAVVTGTAEPHIRITSQLKIHEPVMQILVEVVWSSGRMLREYTLFLDPPTFASSAPAPKVSTAPPVAEPVAAPPAKSTPAPAEPVTTAPEPQVEEITTDEAASQDPEPQEIPAEKTTTAESATEAELLTDTESADAVLDSGDVYGPVARGETLWGIAREWSQGTDYSINQAMLALQRKNPQAFSQDNINSLKQGAILRLPAYGEVAELTSRQAMLEVMRQAEEARTGMQTIALDYGTPTVADSGDFQASEPEYIPEPELEEDSGRLELVPPVEADDTAADDTAQDDTAQETELVAEPEVSNQALQEDLLRSEEELVNAQQENTYLQQRIAELEVAQQEQSLQVEDSDLANMETSLAEKRAEDKPEPPVAVTPGGEKQAWYAGETGWLAGIGLAVILLVIWGLRRRAAKQDESERSEEGKAAVKAVKEEAEDLLEILDKYEAGATTQTPAEPEPELEPEPGAESESKPKPKPESEPELEPDLEPEPEPEPESEPEAKSASETRPAAVTSEPEHGEDEEPNDPELKLDLARAYLSLGDKEAAKSMLEEVLEVGDEEQKAEAQQMMDEL